VRKLVCVDQQDAVAAALRDVVDKDLIGVYLYGSSVDGGLRPASDIDVLAVTRSPLSPAARSRLAERVMSVSGERASGRSLEVTVVVQDEVNPWRYPPVADFVYGDWLAASLNDPAATGPAATPNLAVEITQILQAQRVLTGPPAKEVLAIVPPADLARACRDCIPSLLEDLVGDERNVVLTFARIWCTLETGRILSKDRAAEWAAPRLPADLRPVLEHARHLYLTTPYAQESWPAGLRESSALLVDHIIHRLP
jgi:streptomycin 3"-adenylyltransferase